MLLEFEDGSWIEYKKLTVRGLELLRKGRVIEALPFHIIRWSEDVPINVKTCGMLDPKVVEELRRKLLESAEPILSLDKQILKRWLTLMLKGQTIRTSDREIFLEIQQNYFQYALLYTDHKGNIINLPEQGGILDQPVDWMFFLLAFKTSFVEELANNNKGR
ncbi:hypothetical protein HNP65_000306 [Thermosipho japonicus]|uniref:Uncharacterized protein n=1 Tax=Thermosipho japonicus TaxID=90323 RepID=A0A841GL75_9BACT|nr:hypothetical protein [Thermosipho japonicus]MBB6061884.1 hypothetical protein [Thermosipho japonicus]